MAKFLGASEWLYTNTSSSGQTALNLQLRISACEIGQTNISTRLWSYGWLEAPQAHVSSMRATRLLYLSSPDVEEGVHFSLRHAQKSIHFNRTHIPQPPFSFHQTFHIFSLLHSPNTMIHGVRPFSWSNLLCIQRRIWDMESCSTMYKVSLILILPGRMILMYLS